MGPLVSTEILARALEAGSGNAGLVLLDATTLLPGERFDPEQAFLDAHLPGARRFDIEAFSDPDSPLPHMVPSQGRFARLIAALGVSNHSDIVFYDQNGVVCASRGWWLAGLFGHDRVRVLDGGLPAWIAEGRAIETGSPAPAVPGNYVPHLRTARLTGLGDMIALSERAGRDHSTHLLDARGKGRFEATVAEPRAGLPGGHIPGSANLPFGDLLDGPRFRSPDALRRRFADAGVQPGDQVVTSCGSGLTASVLSLGLVAAGLGEGALYDGSWTEWAQSSAPRATGAAQ